MVPALFRPVKARTDVAKGVAERGTYSVMEGEGYQLHPMGRCRAISLSLLAQNKRRQ